MKKTVYVQAKGVLLNVFKFGLRSLTLTFTLVPNKFFRCYPRPSS